MQPATTLKNRSALRTVEIISDLAGLESISAAWLRLESRTRGATFFQSYAWCRYCMRVRHEHKSQLSEPAIVVVREAGELMLIWPLAIVPTGVVSLAQDLTEPFAQYSDALADPTADIEQLLDLAWQALARRRVDGLVLRKVRADAAIGPWLTRRASAFGVPLQAPSVSFSSPPDLASYRRTLAIKTRKNLRNLRNRLAREGTPVHAVITDPRERAQLIERCFLDRADWLDAGGLSSTAFSDPLFGALVRGLAVGSDDAPPVTVMRLALQRDCTTETVSLHWGFEHNGRYYTFMAAKNPAFDTFSPGRLHLEDVVTACAARGVQTVDFLAPAMTYKTSQATDLVDVFTYGLPTTLRGRLAINGWHGYVRPAIKKAVLAAPISLRRLILRTAVAG